MAAFVFVLPEAAFPSQEQTLLSKPLPTPTTVTGGAFVQAVQESVISDSWNCKDWRGCEVFALIHLIYHLLSPAAGEGERY